MCYTPPQYWRKQMAEFNAELALEQFELRKKKNEGKQIDNGSLPAGSPMYYYCRKCGELVDTRPEVWVGNPPPKYCDSCQVLVQHGLV